MAPLLTPAPRPAEARCRGVAEDFQTRNSREDLYDDTPIPLRLSELLAPRTTMRVGGVATALIEAHDNQTVIEAVRWADSKGLPLHVLGGGSNVVVADTGVHGLVLAMNTRGREMARDGASLLVTARAGETWDDLVADCVEEGLGGLECLSGIPGSVGATPIQNVGAYGQEVSDTLHTVAVYDRQTEQVVDLPSAACGFGYRNSRFKRDPEQRHIVLSVTFRLLPGGTPVLRYDQLRRQLAETGDHHPTVRSTRDAVLCLRRAKSMVHAPDDAFSHGCGSFFTNPIVCPEQAQQVARAAQQEPVGWSTADGRVKLAAAWLIERAGFARGSRQGAVGLSPHHSLAVVNHGGATATAVVEFARAVQEAVATRFGIVLHPEPSFWGFSAFEHRLPVM